jgi:hypothetical protein
VGQKGLKINPPEYVVSLVVPQPELPDGDWQPPLPRTLFDPASRGRTEIRRRSVQHSISRRADGVFRSVVP